MRTGRHMSYRSAFLTGAVLVFLGACSSDSSSAPSDGGAQDSGAQDAGGDVVVDASGPFCGDGVKNGMEVCDDGEAAPRTCAPEETTGTPALCEVCNSSCDGYVLSSESGAPPLYCSFTDRLRFRRYTYDFHSDMRRKTRMEHELDKGFDSIRVMNEDSYDSQGRVVSTTVYTVASGINYVRTTVWDDIERTSTAEMHPGGGSTVTQRTVTTYDDHWRPLVVERDDNDDAVPDYRRTWVYDSQGFMTLDEVDSDADGTPDTTKVNIREYDAEGRPIRTAKNQKMDGSFDFQSVLAYWGLTNVIKTNSRDDDNDATVERHWEFDDKGRTIRFEFDQDDDGSLDRLTTTTFAADGLSSTDFVDVGADSSVDIEVYTTYNADGNMLEEKADVGVDGSFDSLYTRSYDACGFLAQVDDDRNNDGNRARTVTVTSDSYGNSLSHVQTNNPDTEPTPHTDNVWDYSCWSGFRPPSCTAN